MEPILKGWVWDIPFYPFVNNRYRTLRDIFWYDSSDETAFEYSYGKDFQILIPEYMIRSPQEAIDIVHRNKDRIIAEKKLIIHTDHKGNWDINISPEFK
jgi:hypothetical protein